MDDLNNSLTILPNDILLRIFELHAKELTDSLDGLMQFSHLRMVSKKFNSIIDDGVIDSLFIRTIRRKFSKQYLPKRITTAINKRDIKAFQTIYHISDSHFASKMYRNYFWNILQDSDVDFMREYLAIGSPTNRDILSYAKILNALEVANERTDDQFAMVLFLLPYLVSFIPNVDPWHIYLIELSLMYGMKLTIEPEFKNDFRAQFLAVKPDSPNSFGSEILLRLLEPKKPKVIIPKGRILGPTKTTDLFVDIKTDFKKGRPKFRTTNFALRDDKTYTIQFITANNTEKTIKFTKNEAYEYEGVKTTNLYQLFVTTSIFSQLLDSFPHQHVAFTEEAMKLPFEEQPWFFGALTDEEVENMVSGAAGQKTILMRSVGASVWLHFSKNDREPARKPLRFDHDQNFWSVFNSDSFSKSNHKFHLGFYNNGFVKDLPIFQFFKALDKGDFDEIKGTFIAKRLCSVHPAFQDHDVLLTYLNKNKVANEEVIEWMIDNHFPVKIDFTTMKILLTNLGVTVKTIERCWNMRSESIDTGALVTKFLNKVQTMATSSVSFPQYFKAGHQRKLLVNLAWRYGNDDNYFKMLPGEIIEMICGFGLDPTQWEEIAYFLLAKTTSQVEFNIVHLPTSLRLDFARFSCDNFSRFTLQSHVNFMSDFFWRLRGEHSKYDLFDYFALLKRYLPKMKSHYMKPENLPALADLLHTCLKTTSKVTKAEKKLNLTKKTQAFDLLKLLLDFEPLRRHHMTECHVSDYLTPHRIPCFWLVIRHKNSDGIAYLVANKWMPLEPSAKCPYSATEYACVSGHADLVELLVEGNAPKVD